MCLVRPPGFPYDRRRYVPAIQPALQKQRKKHCYWNIVEAKRCADGRVVQRQVLYLGEINDSQREAWCRVIEVFDETHDGARNWRYSPPSARYRHAKAHASRCGSTLCMHRAAAMGRLLACLRSVRQLGLDALLASTPAGSSRRHPLATHPADAGGYRCSIPAAMAPAPIVVRANRDGRSARRGLRTRGKDALYRCLDKLLPHKRALFHHLTERWQDLFGVRFDIYSMI